MSRERSGLMTTALSLAILSLFTTLEIHTSLVIIRLFDLFVAVIFIYVIAEIALGKRLKIAPQFYLLLPFFLIHVLSAAPLDLNNALREAIQAGVILSFAFIIATHVDKIDMRRFTRLMIIGLVIITVYNIVWHISHGYLTGWKRLDEPKFAFTILPMILACILAFGDHMKRERKLVLWSAWFLFAVIIILSGERKALILFAILTSLLMSKGRIQAMLPVLLAGFLLFIILVNTISDPYLQRQFSAILDPFGSGGSMSLSALSSGQYPTSLSNAQRFFAFEQGTKLFWDNPIFGVGTNAYAGLIQARFYFLPDYLTAGIHNEFFRVLVENGIIGLLCFMVVPIASLFSSTSYLRKYGRSAGISRLQGRVLLTILYIPTLFSLGFEASGSQAMILYCLLALFPSFIRQHLMRRSTRLRNILPSNARKQNLNAQGVFQKNAPYIGNAV